MDPVQEKVAKFAESYGMKLENVLFNMDGTIELYLPSGEVIKEYGRFYRRSTSRKW